MQNQFVHVQIAEICCLGELSVYTCTSIDDEISLRLFSTAYPNNVQSQVRQFHFPQQTLTCLTASVQDENGGRLYTYLML